MDENGLISGSKSIESFNSIYEKEIDQLVHSLSGRFLPAIVDGENTPSIFYVDINVSPQNTNSTQQKQNMPYICAIKVNYSPSKHVGNNISPYVNVANTNEEDKSKIDSKK